MNSLAEKQQEMLNDDHRFFQEAASELMDRMYGAAMRLTRNETDAEELVADTLEKAWRNLHSLENRASFAGWIMRILSNTYLSAWRKQQVRKDVMDHNVNADDLDDSHLPYARLNQPFLLWWGTPEQTFVNKLLVKEIQDALDGLAEGYRVVVMMVEVMCFSYEEAAQTLEVPVGTVRSRLNRGRRQLQDALWRNARDAGIEIPQR